MLKAGISTGAEEGARGSSARGSFENWSDAGRVAAAEAHWALGEGLRWSEASKQPFCAGCQPRHFTFVQSVQRRCEASGPVLERGHDGFEGGAGE